MQIPHRLNGERVVAVFPIVNERGLEEFVAITTDDDLGPHRVFTPRRVNSYGEQPMATDPFRTLPAALRYARQACGWG